MEEVMDAESLSNHLDTAVELAIRYTPSFIAAIVVLIIGLWLINRFVNFVGRALERANTEPTLAKFLKTVVSIGLKVLLVISVAGMIGIQTTSFIAVLGAAGLAIGLALQGSLANFAGGVLILLFRPYKVGDYVEAQGVGGTVKEIGIFNTQINTPDNKRIIVPNGSISNGIITNYSAEPTRRVDFLFGIGYGDDIAKAKEVLTGLAVADERVFDDPEPQIVVGNLGDSAVEIIVRVWANSVDYWAIKFDLTEQAKIALEEAGISIPFPQRDVHLFQAEA